MIFLMALAKDLGLPIDALTDANGIIESARQTDCGRLASRDG